MIVGGGVQGLWLAREAVRAGLEVGLVEAEKCGGGASGGLLGALMPHVPTGWSEKKQFQFDALVSLEQEAAALTAETGIETGYVRCGRAMPVRAQGFLRQFETRRDASRLHWRTVCTGFELELLDTSALTGWLEPDEAPLGIFFDPLAARIDPKPYIAALKASIIEHCAIEEGWEYAGYDPVTGRVKGTGGKELIASRVVLAAGSATFRMLTDLTRLPMGGGVKGQAVLMAAQLPAERPVLFDDGLYIVAHGQDRCAVGSTSEKVFEDPFATDELINVRVARARVLCPPLRDAEVIATWAGIRPQSIGRDPIVGRVLSELPIYVASGGFKITFGIAHAVAERLIAGIVEGRDVCGLPSSFAPDRHIEIARVRAGEIAEGGEGVRGG